MKKILLLFLIFTQYLHPMMQEDTPDNTQSISFPGAIGSTRHSNYDKDRDANNDNDDGIVLPFVQAKKEKRKWSFAKKFVVGLLVVNTVGLGTDIASFKTSQALDSEVSPITAYPFRQGVGYPFSPQLGPDRNPNCTYTQYAGGEWPTVDFPGAKGECPCDRGACVCTVEECPPADSYKKYWNATFATQITSIVARVVSMLGIGIGTLMYNDCL